jgi:hypothetical protein
VSSRDVRIVCPRPNVLLGRDAVSHPQKNVILKTIQLLKCTLFRQVYKRQGSNTCHPTDMMF